MYLVIYYVVVLLGVVTATALSFVMTGRLHKLTGTVRQIARGDLDKRSSLSSQDEFGQLSRDIDLMADTLQENIVRLETQTRRQEAFMGAFAHELKTPMTSIIGYADLLRQDGLDDYKRQRAANYIFTEGQRLEKLSFKLLDLLLLKKDEEIQRRLVDRYDGLRSTVWSDESMLKRADSYAEALFDSGAFGREYARWFEDQIPPKTLESFTSYMLKRLAYMDGYIDALR